MSKRIGERVPHRGWPPPPKSHRLDYSMSLEDDGYAILEWLTCGCGTTTEYDSKSIGAGDIVECPECGVKWKAKWKGMQLRRVDDE